MNNNQTQPTNQPNPNRFHLKIWQWLPTLILAAGIAGGVFVFLSRGTPIAPQSEEIAQRIIGDTNKVKDQITNQNQCEGLTEEECKKNSNCSPHIIMADPTGDVYAGCLEKAPTQWAEEKGDYAFCDQEQEEQPKWWCYILVARKNKDLSVCDKIIDEKRIQQCYEEVQREIEKISSLPSLKEDIFITTDKTEYEQGEAVKIDITGIESDIRMRPVVFIFQQNNDKWEKLARLLLNGEQDIFYNPTFPADSIPSYENYNLPISFSWNQNLVPNTYLPIDDGTTATFEHVSKSRYKFGIQTQQEKKFEIIYSNEFEIK